MRKTAKRNKILHPSLSQRSARSLFHPFLFCLFCPSAHKVAGKHTTILFVDVRWRVIMWSLSSLKEQVEAQTGFHWGPLKHTHIHTLSVWEKNASKRETAVWVAREDGDQVKGEMAYCKLHLCVWPSLRLHDKKMGPAWEPVILSCLLGGVYFTMFWEFPKMILNIADLKTILVLTDH